MFRASISLMLAGSPPVRATFWSNSLKLLVRVRNVQMVTLGNGKGGRPTLGDDVEIYTGATVFGGVRIGNNVTIGAGAVVFTDVPDNCTAVGNPARIIPKLRG